MTPLLVAVGGAFGAAARFALGRRLDQDWPWGTLLVNLVGSLVLGLLVGGNVDGRALALLGTGFCGGLTTYSAFAVQTVASGRRRGPVYAALTIAGCLAMATLGHLLGSALS